MGQCQGVGFLAADGWEYDGALMRISERSRQRALDVQMGHLGSNVHQAAESKCTMQDLEVLARQIKAWLRSPNLILHLSLPIIHSFKY